MQVKVKGENEENSKLLVCNVQKEARFGTMPSNKFSKNQSLHSLQCIRAN